MSAALDADVFAVVVAVRRADEAKTRLAGALSADARRALVHAMLDDVLAAARRAHGGALYVLTPDDAYAATAARYEATLLPDAGRGFNIAVCAAVGHAALRDAPGALILPVDIPQVRSDDLRSVLAALAAPDAQVVLVPSADGGTAALGLRPPSVMAPHFGIDSAAAHRATARAAGLTLRELSPPSLAADIDTPADLAAVRDRVGPATGAVLATLPAGWPDGPAR
ncbi:MAG: 2-phospho-L-lactate guanylyltransferase [Dehalococcoidia bacterium]